MALLDGKRCVVTGATGGIGLITARELARMGGEVVLVGRSTERLSDAVAAIRSDVPNALLETARADLALQRDVRSLAADLGRRFEHINVLVNNAGAIFSPREETAEGLEMTWALNHMGYFTLTTLLLDQLRASGSSRVPTRIINVSSDAHRMGKINFDDLEGKQRYSAWLAYGQSKLANIMFTYELARRLGDAPVVTNTLHPGVVATRFAARMGKWGEFGRKAMNLFSISPEEGAQTSVYLASDPQMAYVSGLYFEKCQPKSSNQASYQQEDAARLWEVSEAYANRFAA